MAEGDPTLRRQAMQHSCAASTSVPTHLSAADEARHATGAQFVDLALLQALLMMPLQRVEDLALIVGVSLRTAYRHLDRLHANGLVDTVIPGNLGRASSQVAYLTRAGMRALAGGDPASARTLGRAWGADMRGLARLLPRLPARIAVLQTLPTLLMAFRRSVPGESGNPRERGGVQRSAGSLEALPLRWHWTLDYRHAFTYRERPRRLAVDAVLAVRVAHLAGRGGARVRTLREPGRIDGAAFDSAADWYAVWVFLDPGVGNARALVSRLSALVAYRESSERWPLYAQFPPVLILTASAHRASVWQQAAREAALHLRADPLAGVIQIAPLGSVSCWPLSVSGTPPPRSVPDPDPSWIELASGVPTTLAALFATSLPEAALPPGLIALPLAPLMLDSTHTVAAASTIVAHGGAKPAPALTPSVSAGHGSEGRSSHGPLATCERSKARLSSQRPDELSLRLSRARKRGQQGPLDSDQRTTMRAWLALALTRREQTLLDLLATHPLVSQDDLAVWMDIAPAWVDRLRRQLRSVGLIQMFRVPKSTLLPLRPRQDSTATSASSQGIETAPPSPADTTYLLRLTPLAWNFLAAVYHLPARQLAGGAPQARASMIASTTSARTAHRQEPARLPGKALHQAGVYRFFTLLNRDIDARKREGCEPREQLLWWDSGVACVRQYRAMGRWGTLRPDATGEFQCDGRHVRFWLEWDTGSMGLNTLREKLERYATYAQTTTWRLEDSHSLPVLLIVTPDASQEQRVARLVDELQQRARLQWPGPLLIRTTTASRLMLDGPLAQIWLHLLSPISLDMQTDRGGVESLWSCCETAIELTQPL